MNRHALVLFAALSLSAAVVAEPMSVLFVGDSFTFGRVDPVMGYNAAQVHDLTAGFHAISSAGSNPWEPHPWGGVPGIFKQMTVDAGLDYEVSISARNAASLRGHFLNSGNPAWDLRGNVASKRWSVVVLQERSDAALPPGKGKHANPASFKAYADRFERFIHGGAANPNASAATRVYLTGTWARPDMVFAHQTTRPDPRSAEGRPTVVGGPATLYYTSLEAMTLDLHAAFAAKLASNPKFAGVIPVGDAFQRALDLGVAQRGGFFTSSGSDGSANPPQPGDLPNLWWADGLHASKYGSYLDALLQFGTITGIDPASLGAGETAARELGIGAADALALQRVASLQLGFASPTR